MTTILLGLQPEKVSSEHLGRIRALAPEAAVVVTKDRAEMEAQLDEVEIAAGSVPYDLIVRAPALRWFQQWWAGADWLSEYPEAVRRPFILTNASGVHAVPMSEHVLALMLGFSRGMSLSKGPRHAANGRRSASSAEFSSWQGRPRSWSAWEPWDGGRYRYCRRWIWWCGVCGAQGDLTLAVRLGSWAALSGRNRCSRPTLWC